MEQIVADPGKQAAFREAVREQWYELAESGGSGIDGARKTALAVTAGRTGGRSATGDDRAAGAADRGRRRVHALVAAPRPGYDAGAARMLIGALVALIGSPRGVLLRSRCRRGRKNSAIVQQKRQK